jgi:NAD(P)-dependent dehydrogenase (short-subunit alcohol dehydrogenase family)
MPRLSKLSDMSGRRVLITGAVGHVGRVMAEAMAELGASLILVDRPGADFSNVQSEIAKVSGVECDCRECDLEFEEQRVELIECVANSGLELNCLINNAAFVGTSELPGWAAPLAEQSLPVWRKALEVNLTAPFHLSKAFAPLMRRSKGANIINITSIYGRVGPDWSLYNGTSLGNPAAYAASKGGLAQLTKWLATTLAPEIRVNAIAPGGIFRNQPQEFVMRYEARTPLRRMAKESDLAGVSAFLASDLSAYCTGECIHIDGGWVAW